MALGPLSAREKQIALKNGRQTSAELWAESPNPPDPTNLDSKSAKTWSNVAEEMAENAREYSEIYFPQGLDFDEALSDGGLNGQISGGKRTYELNESHTSLDIESITDASVNATSYKSITLGGNVDNTVTLVLSQSDIPSGQRWVGYTSITGTLLAGDWIAIQGHNPISWTTDSGRNVIHGSMMQVRGIDEANLRILLHEAIIGGMNNRVVDGTTFSITAQKVIPKKVDLSQLYLKNIQVNLQYIIDSDINVSHIEVDSAGCGIAISWATGCNIFGASRVRGTGASNHNIDLSWLYGCNISGRLIATNTSATSPAKAIRGKSWTACNSSLLSTDAGMNVIVLEGVSGGYHQISGSGAGARNIDNGIITGNRNDSIHIQYSNGILSNISAIEPDCTGLEIFGDRNSNYNVNIVRTRSDYTTGDSGILNIKGISRGTYVTGKVKFSNNTVNLMPAVRLEYFNTDSDGHQNDITLDLDVDAGNGIGINLVSPPSGTTSSIDAKTVIKGKIKAAAPIRFAQYIGGTDISGIVEVDTTQSNASHAISDSGNSTGNKLHDLVINGTLADTRRAISIASENNILSNITSDGGEFRFWNPTLANVNLRNYNNINRRLRFVQGGTDYSFYPAFSGGWEVPGSGESFNATAGEYVLTVPVGTWTNGDLLKRVNAARGQSGWRWDGTYWKREGSRIIIGSVGVNPPAINANASHSFTMTVAGVGLRDYVSTSVSISTAGLMVYGSVTTANTITITMFNPTTSSIDLEPCTVYAKVETWNT